jgi:hypothetical protein
MPVCFSAVSAHKSYARLNYSDIARHVVQRELVYQLASDPQTSSD